MIGESDIRRVSEMERRARQQAETEAWPAGVIARYLTVGGAHVDLTGSGDYTDYQCTGCPYGSHGWPEHVAHERAQAHAEKCRAQARPAVAS